MCGTATTTKEASSVPPKSTEVAVDLGCRWGGGMLNDGGVLQLRKLEAPDSTPKLFNLVLSSL